MKGFILRNAYYDATDINYQVDRIKTELENLGVEVDVIKNGYGAYVNSNCEIVNEYQGYDFCVFLDKDKYLGEMLYKSGVRCFNNYKAIEVCDDKMKTFIELSSNNVSVPTTISAPLCFSLGAKVGDSEVNEIIDKLSLPLVAKKSFSSQGKGVYLINTKKDLIDFINNNPFEPKIYQKYVSSSFGKDVRIICIGKKYFSAMLRYSDNDFRSNSYLGGKAKPFRPDKSFIDLAEKVATLLGLDYMGIDLMFGEKGEPIVCEVNSNAFFTAMEKVCNVNVAKEYAKYIIKTVSEELW